MRYMVVIEEGPDSFGAYVPDLPGCIAAADTREEVLRPDPRSHRVPPSKGSATKASRCRSHTRTANSSKCAPDRPAVGPPYFPDFSEPRMLWACLRFPRSSLEAVCDGNASCTPMVVIDGPQQRRQIVLANESARDAGVRSDQSLTAAQALCPTLSTKSRDPAAERQAIDSSPPGPTASAPTSASRRRCDPARSRREPDAVRWARVAASTLAP